MVSSVLSAVTLALELRSYNSYWVEQPSRTLGPVEDAREVCAPGITSWNLER